MKQAGRHVLVIGAGVIGLSVAWYCARRGFRVTLVEWHAAERDGCSFGNAGMVCPSHFIPLAAPGMVSLALKWMWNPKSPFYIRPRVDPALWSWGWKFWRSANAAQVERAIPLLHDLGMASRTAFVELASLPGVDFGMVKEGLLMLCRTEHALEEEARLAERARAMGMPVEVFNRQQTAEFDPGLRMDVAGAVYFKADCHLAPHLLMSALERLATDAGAEIHWETEITDFQTSGNRISGVQTNRGMLQADEYVLCAGSWSPLLAHRLRIALPMQAGKGYSLTLQQPRRLPRTCAILTEARIAVTPIGQTLRFGGTMELAGLDERIDPRRIEGIIEAVPRYLPEFQPEDFRGVQPWRGLRPVSPDGLPYIGRTARWGNLVMATGHAMLGVSLAPITGKLVSQIVAGESPEIDLSLLAPERFSA